MSDNISRKKYIFIVLILLLIPLLIIASFILVLKLNNPIDNNSITMPSNTKIKDVFGSYRFVYFLDENNTLWGNGRDREERSIGTAHNKTTNDPVQIATNVSQAGDSFYVTQDGELFVWNDLTKIFNLSETKINKAPTKTEFRQVKKVYYDLDSFVLILFENGQLYGFGDSVICNEYNGGVQNNYHAIMDNVIDFSGNNGSFYIITKNHQLFSLGDNSSNLFETQETYIKEPQLLYSNVKEAKIFSSGKAGFITNDDDLYLIGNYVDIGNFNKPTMFENNVKTFSADHRNLYFIKNDGFFYIQNQKYLNNVKLCYALSSTCFIIDSSNKVYGFGNNAEMLLGFMPTEISFENRVCINP